MQIYSEDSKVKDSQLLDGLDDYLKRCIARHCF